MTKYILSDTVQSVEHKIVRQWTGGIGKDAEFEDDSIGWWAVLGDSRIAFHLGTKEPALKKGDRIRLTIEKEKK